MTQKDILVSKIKIFLFALLSNIRVSLIGQLPISELFALFSSFSIPRWKSLLKVSDVRKINIAYLLFFVSQVISDIVNQSTFQNAARGWANILMAIVVFSFLTNQLNNYKSIIIIFLIGQIISMILFEPSSEGLSLEDMAFFKFRIAPILNNVILIISYYLLRQNRYNLIYVVILLIGYGLFCMLHDFRSNGMFMIMTGIILLNKKGLKKVGVKKSIIVSLLFLVIFQITYMYYVNQVFSGNFGGEHSREQLVRLKNPYNPLNLLQSGRSEVFVAMYAIKDKPLFGFGSWAPDQGGKYTALQYEMNNEKEKFNGYYQSSGELIIPSHSVIFGAWLYAGIGGFLSMGFILIIFLKRSITLLKNPLILKNTLAPIIIFFVITGLWTFIFSPLPHIRQTLPIFMALIIVMHKKVLEFKIRQRINIKKSAELKNRSLN